MERGGFNIALVMAGAASAGACTAGVFWAELSSGTEVNAARSAGEAEICPGSARPSIANIERQAPVSMNTKSSETPAWAKNKSPTTAAARTRSTTPPGAS